MDGVRTPESITKEALELMYPKVVAMAKVMAKSAAMHKIRSQPFFGDYWSGKKCGDTIKIRRPVNYIKG